MPIIFNQQVRVQSKTMCIEMTHIFYDTSYVLQVKGNDKGNKDF